VCTEQVLGHLPVPPKYDTTLSEASTNLAKKYVQRH